MGVKMARGGFSEWLRLESRVRTRDPWVEVGQVSSGGWLEEAVK